MDSQQIYLIYGATAFSFALIMFLIYLLIKKSLKYKNIKGKYQAIIDIDAEVELRRATLGTIDNQTKELKESYKSKKEIFDQLEHEIAILEETSEFHSYGIYEPQFDFDTSKSYQDEIKKVRNEQKAMVKDKKAIVLKMEWTVQGSEAKGRTMINKIRRLLLRAFNGECDVSITKVKWNNVNQMEKRIEKSYEILNKIVDQWGLEVAWEYKDLKLKELHLVHEYHEKKQEEKEEQRRIKEQMREEQKAMQEIKKAQEEAEKEERQFRDALELARKEVEKAKGGELDVLNEQISKLQAQLEASKEKGERAKSMAEMTKIGHVYIISNIGSFGDDVYKIGLTRRLDPMDRVKELGDASVPFGFDVHAMVYSEDSPELENSLHKAFDDRRLNMVNKRKEFFRVTLEEIESIVKQNHGEIEFTKLAEARQYRETLALQESLKESIEEKNEVFPSEI